MDEETVYNTGDGLVDALLHQQAERIKQLEAEVERLRKENEFFRRDFVSFTRSEDHLAALLATEGFEERAPYPTGEKQTTIVHTFRLGDRVFVLKKETSDG